MSAYVLGVEVASHKVYDADRTRTALDSLTVDGRRWAAIDPEDRDLVRELVEVYDSVRETTRGTYVDHMQAALREFASPTPPKPDEPTGLGAVVEDADGVRHVRTFGGCAPTAWLGHIKEDGGERTRRWSDINAVRILSEGVPS